MLNSVASLLAHYLEYTVIFAEISNWLNSESMLVCNKYKISMDVELEVVVMLL